MTLLFLLDRYEINDPFKCVIANIYEILEPSKLKWISGGLDIEGDEGGNYTDVVDIIQENLDIWRDIEILY